MLAQMAESEEGRAMLKKLQGLRSSMDSLKKQQAGDPIGAAQRVEQQIHGAAAFAECAVCTEGGSRQRCRVLREHGAA